MAVVVSTRSPSDSRYTLTLNINPRSPDVANNRTTVDYSLVLTFSGSLAYGRWHYDPNSYSITINGSTVASGSYTYDFRSSSSKTIASGSTTISHNSDGTKTISASCSASMLKPNYTTETISGSGSLTLSTIPRTSQPRLSASSINYGSAVTIYTDRKSSAFTHRIRVSWNGNTETLSSSVGTSYTWTVPMSYLNRIPNAKSTVGTIYLDTYSGGTLIGTKTVRLTTNAPPNVGPNIGSVNLTEAVSGIAGQFGAFVQGESRIRVTGSATGQYGASISSYQIQINRETGNGSSYTSGYLVGSGQEKVVFRATDSRGYTSTKTVVFNVLPYTPPRIDSFSAYRSNSDGSPNGQGGYATAQYNATLTSLNNRNTKSYTVRYRPTSGGEWVEIGINSDDYTLSGNRPLPNVSTSQSYEIELIVKDYFGQASQKITIPTSFVTMDFRAGGKGVAIGKYSEWDALEVDMKSYFYKPVGLDGGVIMQYTGDAGPGINCNTTLLGRCVARIVANGPPNTPGWYYAYFNQDFYNGVVSTDTDRRQAIQDIYTGDTWTRVYSAGKWSPWIKSDFSPTNVPNGSNLNSYTTPGYYSQPSNSQTTNNLNMPEKVAFSLHVYANSGVTQIFTTYYNDVQRYIRSEYNGAWSEWELIPKESQTVRFKRVGANDSTESSSWLDVLKKNYRSLQDGRGYMLHLRPYGAQVWAIGFRASSTYGAFLAFSYTDHVTYVQVVNGQWVTKVIG